jgi:type II secretory pathway component GspD/PulD (secretin)
MKRYILALFCLVFSVLAMGQSKTPLLERDINLNITNQPLSVAFDKIAAQTGVTFSYSPSLVNTNKIVSVKATNKSVREVLALMLDDNVAYKASGKYIILSKAETPGKKVTVSGYVYDKNSGKKVPNTSVYDEKSMTSAVTNEYGYYELEVPKNF